MKINNPFQLALPALTTSNNKPDKAFLFSHPAHFFALGLGTGLSPKAPGTVGTVLGFLLFWLLSPLSPLLFWIALVLSALIGIWFCDKTGRDLGISDHGSIVWDEIVAFALVLAFAKPTAVDFIASFLLFRLFDIWKPFPIRYFDRTVKGGFGVMLDDLLAAGYAIVVLVLARNAIF